ncbi:P-loop containing nucleoside triphosphate hydrolase protein, partial [Cerioporus squamosus]
MKERFNWEEDPRFFQLEGTRAQLEGCDMIIQAPTGSGKTAVAAGPHVWPTSADKTTIMVCPLLALEEEMVETFRDDFGLSAIAVNSTGGKLTNELVQELVSGKYRVVLISPEMLQSPAFINRVLRKPQFAQRILSVVIDEAHCISHWGAGFRKKYSSLGIIRAFLPRGTPIIAVTATLTARVRRDLHRVLHFPPTGSRFINLGNDRSNVSIVVRACEHPQNSYADLDFILPQSISSPADIPKTYLYVDDIRVGGEIIDHLNALLARRAPSLLDTGLIRPFNATLSHEYRSAAMKAFRTSPDTTPPDPEIASSSDMPRCIRILVCTDAAGMGCNVADVDLVVQWKLPKTLSSFVQRAGRAARSKSRTGLAVLLVERSAYSIDLRAAAPLPSEASSAPKASNGNSKKNRANQKGAAAPKGYAKEHGVDRGSTKKADAVALDAEPPRLDLEAADEGLVTFVQAVTCRRKLWAEVFETPVVGVPCCDVCTPELFDRCRPGMYVNTRRSKMPDRGHPDLQAYTRLDEWREEVFARDHPFSQLDSSSILDDATIRTLTTVGSLTTSQVAELLEHTWIWWPRYGQDL